MPRTCAMTLTFGECAENHAGNQQLGAIGEPGSGFTLDELNAAAQNFQAAGCATELVELGEGAWVLIMRNGLKAFGVDAGALYAEHDALDVDKKALMYKKVVNKRARHNLCYDEQDQAACYEKGEGTVVAFPRVPLLQRVRNGLLQMVGEKAGNLKCELNKYYDPATCGIGFHGDGERRRVIAVRLGVSIPMHFQWFQRHKPIGARIKLSLGHGNMYIMSEKSTGWDWKMSSQRTLRHAAGCDKFTTIKGQTSKRPLPTGGANAVQRAVVMRRVGGGASQPKARVAVTEETVVGAIARQLESHATAEPAAVLGQLERLEGMHAVSVETLARTQVAKRVKALRSGEGAVAVAAAALYSRWKREAKQAGVR